MPDDGERPDGFSPIDSDLSPGRRRLRNLVLLGIPTLAASVVVLLLGVPAWVLGIFLVIFVVLVFTNS